MDDEKFNVLKNKIWYVDRVNAEPKGKFNAPMFRKVDIKLACKLYLKYRNKPKLFEKNHIEIVFANYGTTEFTKDEYNEWLFKLTFADIFK